jgi:hypothetical protein
VLVNAGLISPACPFASEWPISEESTPCLTAVSLDPELASAAVIVASGQGTAFPCRLPMGVSEGASSRPRRLPTAEKTVSNLYTRNGPRSVTGTELCLSQRARGRSLGLLFARASLGGQRLGL